MKQRPSLIVGVGILCFVGVMALWLASSGDKAIAEGEHRATIIGSITQTMAQPLELKKITTSPVTLEGKDGIVRRLSIYINLASQDAKGVKAYLTSPSGTKVLLLDGARSTAVKEDGLEGWFGADGLPTEESLEAFAGEPASGTWLLTVTSTKPGKLAKWSLTTDLSPSTKMAAMETYGEYNGGGGDGGCDCRVDGSSRAHSGLLAGLLLLGLLLVRRRR